MSRDKSCFFIGHREADERLLTRLELTIKMLIVKENVRYFYVSGYGGFDRIAAVATKQAKQKYSDITLMLVLHYHPAENGSDSKWIRRNILSQGNGKNAQKIRNCAYQSNYDQYL